MRGLDRRDVLATLAAVAVLGAVAGPNPAAAGSDGEGGGLRWSLIMGVLMTVLYLLLQSSKQAMYANMQSAKVEDGDAAALSNRTRKARKIGTIRQNGSQLVATIERSQEKALAGSRAIDLTIPIPGTTTAFKSRLVPAKGRTVEQAFAAAGSGKTVGSVRMDAEGLIFDLPGAKLKSQG